ncbi:MAG: hypothetical protein GX556_07070 [Fibrobacter sp.]|nr:hypothetical protein [Fibrobacter sp.]
MSFSRLKSSVKLISDFLRKYKRVLFFIAVLAIVLPEVSVYFHRPGRGADIHGYLLAGNDVLENQPLYRNSALLSPRFIIVSVSCRQSDPH